MDSLGVIRRRRTDLKRGPVVCRLEDLLGHSRLLSGFRALDDNDRRKDSRLTSPRWIGDVTALAFAGHESIPRMEGRQMNIVDAPFAEQSRCRRAWNAPSGIYLRMRDLR